MGSNLPSGNQESLIWLEGHIVGWNANYASIGLSSAQVIDLATDIANTRQSFTTVTESRQTAKSDTLDWNLKATDLHKKAAEMITTIKGFAATSGNAGAVYVAADLSPKDPPQPAGAPAQPTNLAATLIPGGDVELTWDGTGPTGTMYGVYRKLDGEVNFIFVGNSNAKDKAFTDTTLPVGTTLATYQIKAVRSGDESVPSGPLPVQFGPTAPPAESEAA